MSDSNASTVNDNVVFLDAHGTGVEKEASLKETSDSDQTKNPEQAVAADDYPHGIRLFFLAGSSIMGVFLISLDQVSWGKAFKYFDLKITFIISVLIFELGSLICGVAPNSTALIIGRAIAGVGGAGISVGGTSIVAFSAEPKQRPVLMGFIGLT